MGTNEVGGVPPFRMVHNAQKINLKGESMRKIRPSLTKSAKSRRQGKTQRRFAPMTWTVCSGTAGHNKAEQVLTFLRNDWSVVF
jgi:hypothetical protein